MRSQARENENLTRQRFASDATLQILKQDKPLNPRSDMKTTQPYQRSFYCAGLVFAIMVGLYGRTVGMVLFQFCLVLCAALAVGKLASGSKAPWKWWKHLAAVFICYCVLHFLLLGLLVAFGGGLPMRESTFKQ